MKLTTEEPTKGDIIRAHCVKNNIKVIEITHKDVYKDILPGIGVSSAGTGKHVYEHKEINLKDFLGLPTINSIDIKQPIGKLLIFGDGEGVDTPKISDIDIFNSRGQVIEEIEHEVIK
jgi:hypothetical protein